MPSLPFVIVPMAVPIATKLHECMEMWHPENGELFNWLRFLSYISCFSHTSKTPSMKRTITSAGTPALAANGVINVNTDVTAIPKPNIFIFVRTKKWKKKEKNNLEICGTGVWTSGSRLIFKNFAKDKTDLSVSHSHHKIIYFFSIIISRCV